MIYEIAPDKVAEIGIILNDHRPFTNITALAKSGWDVICNGDMCNFALDKNGYAVFNYFCRVNGKTLSPLPDAKGNVNCYHEWVMAWNNGDTKLSWIDPYPISNMEKYDNVIGCTGLITNGKIRNPILTNSQISGRRARTAIGQKADGSIVFWCTADGYAGDTLDDLADKLYNLGCVQANALDGGGSSQMICPDGKILTSRLIYNFYGIKLKQEESKEITEIDRTKYYVQCGAYNNSPTVQPYWEKQLQKIKAAGWDNCLAYPSGKYVKVVVGPYPSNNDAYNVSNSIKRKGIGCFALAGKYI